MDIKYLSQNSKLHWAIITLLALYQVIRLILFVNIYGGVEHDAGWFLGISRMLAEQGRYVTMVSTVADPTPGGQENIHGQYQVQDEAGRTYFFPESIGAPGIIPNALIIKLFGAGFWQYRAGPLLFLLISLLLASALLYRLAGLVAVGITHLFFIFYPHLLIFLGYEAMGEIFSLAYILLAYLLFVRASEANHRRKWWFLACGLAVGLAFTTKTISLMALSSLGVAWLWLFWQKRTTLSEGLIVAVSGLLVRAVWELTQLVTITLLFDWQTYLGYIGQHLDFFLNEGGSGVGERGPNDFAFFWDKLLTVREISALYNDTFSLITFLILLLGGPLLLWRLFQDSSRRTIVVLLWGGWLAHSLWFILLSRGGWVRHDWHALMLAVFLLASFVAYAWQNTQQPPKWIHRVVALFLTAGLGVGFSSQLDEISLLPSDKLVERWYTDHLAADRTRIPWMIVPRQAQDDALAALTQLPPTARVFYPEGYKSAEMAVLSGRILYSIQRRHLMPPAAGDVILIGPALISPWRKPTETHVSQAEQQAFIAEILKRVRRDCPKILFENAYYIICGLD